MNVIMPKKMYDIVHFRSVGQNPDGTNKNISTNVGAVIECDNGSLMLKLNYQPTDNQPMYLFAPKPKQDTVPPVQLDAAPF